MVATESGPAKDPLNDVEPNTRLLALHDRVDQEAAEIQNTHAARLQCRRGCSACCVDDITVFEIEAERIRRAHPELLRSGVPHSLGACAFLDQLGACRVYESRPYVCRTQGLPLRFFHEDAEGEIREERDICELNLDGPPLSGLSDSDCWTLGPTELELGQLQESAGDGRRERVPLRDLFESPAASD